MTTFRAPFKRPKAPRLRPALLRAPCQGPGYRAASATPCASPCRRAKLPAAVERAAARSRILDILELTPRTYAVSTIHRAENTDDPERLARVVAWLEEAALTQPVVMAVHPRTRKLLERNGIAPRGLRLVDPLGYLDMTQLVHHAASVFTDSGGLQKEAYFHRVPCVTLRDETEWVETIEAGWNRLWTEDRYKPRREIPDYGDGRSAAVVAELMHALV
ncbi:UDP-N-acetylglucosamine 2-epimerase [Chelatococcus sp. SYSU_G07232]|uniref:UDP-N-acetylglucosamine 2-epimerase n=1 Tax=Chelatococcus albus TaxID=3047466 RepID=A0ABT7AEQ8_9HYPH|nr:UDP-N-acetylglucosamine 2-epimerase [Chelatococcus sp. SYSU_G07232]MDJ1157585.1 UDP-N-acetylglucosamine 2-epimerase [Chelatococcus sp. SYSU_G07232]